MSDPNSDDATPPGTQREAFETDGRVHSSPIVVDETVYVGSYDKNLYAVGAATGTKEWAFETDGEVYSSPTVADGTVYVGSNDGDLYALDAATGSKEWAFETSEPVVSSPIVVDETVYVGSTDENLYAVDIATGTEEWIFETDDRVTSSPIVADGTVYVGSWDNYLYALDSATGTKEWAFKTDGWVRSSPTVADGTVYVGSNDNNLYAVDASTGDQQWAFKTSGSVYSSPTVADETVYVGSNDNNLYAVAAERTATASSVGEQNNADSTDKISVKKDSDSDDTTPPGTQKWAFETDGWVRSSPTVADGTVYVGSNDNNLYAVDASTGDQQWAFKTSGSVHSSPTVADETVYVGSNDNNLYAVSTDTDSRPNLRDEIEIPTLKRGDFVYLTVSWTAQSAKGVSLLEDPGLLLGSERYPVIERDLIGSPANTTKSYLLAQKDTVGRVDGSTPQEVIPAPSLASVFDQPTANTLNQLGMSSVATFLAADLSEVASQPIGEDALREMRESVVNSLDDREIVTVSVTELYRWEGNRELYRWEVNGEFRREPVFNN
jgi:outer membrane protein assembly factor BamB